MHPLALPWVRRGAAEALLLREWMRTGVRFNPLSTRFQRNPYPTYRALRLDDPVHWSELARGWILTRHADVLSVLRDPRFSVDRANARSIQEWRRRHGMGPFQDFFDASLLGVDPPDHTRLRTLVNRAFTPRAVEAMRPRVAAVAHELLDAALPAGQMDFIRDFADPLPVIVIAEMLGLPVTDRALFKRWSDDLGAGLDPFLGDPVLRRADRSVEELRTYLAPHIAARRAEPRDDLISALVRAELDGDALTPAETETFIILLLAAGNETTTNLLGNGLLALLRHPEQLRALRDDPGLAATAVEELLRFDSPVQYTARAALEEAHVGGVRIRPGDTVVAIIGAANRDPAVFTRPGRLEIRRHPNPHIAFGHGSHFCLGAPLARLEAQVALPIVLERLGALHAVEPNPPRRPTVTLRGLRRLPLRFESRSAPPQSASRL